MVPGILGLACIALVISLLGLVTIGARWKRSGFMRTVAYGIAVTVSTYVVGKLLWALPASVLWTGTAIVFCAILGAFFLRRDWNPAGQAFFAVLIVACVSFVAMTTRFAFSRPLLGMVGDIPLIALEAFAFFLLVTGTHEVLDVLCRVHWRRRSTGIERDDYEPFVSVHVAAHNEPPDLVIQTLASLSKFDYPSYEVIVLDNNTTDPALWEPVKAYCDEAGLRFAHLENWPGYKSGALNHGLKICDPRTEIIAVIDADFIVDADFLDRTVGYFRDEKTAIVQTAQGFRSEVETGFYRRLALTYKTFDEITMPTRNEHNAIIFAGTMGLIRKSVLEDAGRWGEWCVTEDAELSLRILARGYNAHYVEHVFGHGVMPLTFAAMKSQRFRWCFGGIQILREHWRLMLTGRGTDKDGAPLQLTKPQRYDYMVAALQWFQAPLSVAFGVLLLFGVVGRSAGFELPLRPLVGMFVGVPGLLLTTGLIRGIWGIKARLRVSFRDAFAVTGIFMSMNWAVTLGALQGLVRKEGAFLRTPKFKEHDSFKQVVKTTRAETPWALALSAASVATALTGSGGEAIFLSSLCAWGALIFWTSPVTALIASRTQLRSPALRQRRSLEGERQRKPLYKRPASYVLVGSAASLLFLFLGASVTVGPSPGGLGDVFTLPSDDQPEVKETLDRNATQDPSVVSDDPSAAVQEAAALANAGRVNAPGPRVTPAPAATPGAPGSAATPGSQTGAATPRPRQTPAPQGSQAPADPGSKGSPAPRPSPSRGRP